jgi:hypothetical protein
MQQMMHAALERVAEQHSAREGPGGDRRRHATAESPRHGAGDEAHEEWRRDDRPRTFMVQRVQSLRGGRMRRVRRVEPPPVERILHERARRKAAYADDGDHQRRREPTRRSGSGGSRGRPRDHGDAHRRIEDERPPVVEPAHGQALERSPHGAHASSWRKGEGADTDAIRSSWLTTRSFSMSSAAWSIPPP